MNHLNVLFVAQEELGKGIEKAKVNYSKDSRSRHCKEYFAKRLAALEDNWEKFSLDYSIEHAKVTNYFVYGSFESIRNIWEELKAVFSKRLAAYKNEDVDGDK